MREIEQRLVKASYLLESDFSVYIVSYWKHINWNILCVNGRDSSEACVCFKDVAGELEGWILKKQKQSRVFLHSPESDIQDGPELGHKAALNLRFGDDTISTWIVYRV